MPEDRTINEQRIIADLVRKLRLGTAARLQVGQLYRNRGYETTLRYLQQLQRRQRG